MLVFINYKQNAKPDHELAVKTEEFLKREGYAVFRDESKLKGGENWPEKICRNLEKSDVVVSFVSNASMKSKWVVNEIDEAIWRKKSLIPIIVETLDSNLNFTRYRPRFADIQYIPYKGDFEPLSNEILASLKELKPEYRYRRIVPYHEIVLKTLGKYGFDDPLEVFCYLLEFLQDLHIIFAASAELNGINRWPKLIGTGSCRSFSEAFAHALGECASMYRHNFEIGKKRGSEANWWWEERLGPSECLAEILKEVISKWQPYVEHAKKQMMSRPSAEPKDGGPP
jgi:hypothetical protein